MKAKYIRKSPEAGVMEITPEIAKEMLDTSPGNRRLREWYVDLLAASMRRGEWRVTSQGIGFDELGRLRDAHHRLHGCIKSGVSFWSVVVLGLRVDAYEVTDIGITRTYSDRLNEKRDVADVLRLGCQYTLNCNKPSIDQMKPFLDSGFQDAAQALVEFCGTKRKFYSSAAIKLAACIEIMSGGDADYVLQQYKALCGLDFDQMSSSAKALVRQVENGKAKATDARETLARGLRVFNKEKQSISKIQVNEDDKFSATEFVRKVLKKSASEKQYKNQMFNSF
jgi:hypothetical protein